MVVDVYLYRDVPVRVYCVSLEYQDVRNDGDGAGADRRDVYLSRVVDRCTVGASQLGGILGVGCTANLRVNTVISLHDDPRRAARASGLLAVVGVINIPIIYFSVRWWNTLHQGFSVQPGQTQQLMDPSIKWGMLILAIAFWMYAIAIVLTRVRTIILERERQTSWVQELLGGKS